MDRLYHRLEFRKKTYPKFFFQTFYSKFYLENGYNIPEEELLKTFELILNEAIKETGNIAKTRSAKVHILLNGHGLGMLIIYSSN